MKKLLLLLFFIPLIGFGQKTYVPDDDFENFLEANGMGDSIALNDSVFTSNIITVDSLAMAGNFTNLIGIEDFASLQTLTLWWCPLLTTLDLSNNIALTYFYFYGYAGYSPLTTIDVSQNPNLDYFVCSGHDQLTSLNISNSTALTYLDCSNNPLLTTLDVSNSTALTYLSCTDNLLTTLDLSNSTALIKLNCSYNLLTTLDVSNSTALTELNCYDNPLITLDVSNNINLDTLWCGAGYFSSNTLLNLDLSNNIALTYLTCNGSNLTNLDLSNNTALAWLSCSYNPLLTTLDISNNTALTELHCLRNGNQFTSLDLSGATNLVILECGMTSGSYPPGHLTSLDVSQNTALQSLRCPRNQITSLDVSQNTALIYLHCGNNPLTSLDLRNGNNTNMLSINAYNSSNHNLTCVNVDDSTWSTNNWVSFGFNSWHYFSNNCPVLGCTDTLACNYNLTATVDDGSCLTAYGCTSPAAANYDPTATCDDGSCFLYGCTDSTALNYNLQATIDDSSCTYCVYGCLNPNATNYDSTATCDDSSCVYVKTYVPDANFENYLESNGMGDGIVNNAFVNTYLITNRIQISISYDSIADLTGIEDFTSLTGLNCSNNQLTSLDVSNNVFLRVLICNANDLTSLDVSYNTALTNLNCDDNQLTNLDVSYNTALEGLHCGNNQLISLDLRNGNNTNMSSNNFTNNLQLYCIDVDNPIYSVAHWSNYKDPWAIYSTDCSVYGCTDSSATNYDSLATANDSSCIYCNINGTIFSSTATSHIICDGFAAISTASNYPITTYSWKNSSGTIVSTTDLAVGLCNDAYIVTVTDSAGCTFTDTLILGIVHGCTDVLATNYNPFAVVDDSSCWYCDLTLSLYVSQNSTNTSCDGWVYASTTTSNTPVTYNWSNGSTQNIISGLCSGTYTLTITDAVGCTMDTTFIIGPVIYGCTDSNATNYDPTANVDDGSCTYACGDPITGLFMSDVIHDRATFNWDDMNSSTCNVDQIRIRYREVGTSGYTNKTMGAPVGSGCNTANTSKRILNLSPSTTYEYDFKLWYCGAPTINWHAAGTFTTAAACDNVTNVTAIPNSATQTVFCWDSVSTYSFVRLQYRENVPGSSFSNIGGFGVMAPATCKTKNGLTPGTQYRVMYRTWCNPLGGPYRSPVWDGPVIWDQPASIRLEGENTAITNLEVYPNPSRDIFNITFTSNEKQDLEIRIINVIGEHVFIESKQQFVGEYTKQISLEEYPKAIYFLEIETDDGVINKKLILQ